MDRGGGFASVYDKWNAQNPNFRLDWADSQLTGGGNNAVKFKVLNVAPTVSLEQPPDTDEGTQFTLIGSVSDPGLNRQRAADFSPHGSPRRLQAFGSQSVGSRRLFHDP